MIHIASEQGQARKCRRVAVTFVPPQEVPGCGIPIFPAYDHGEGFAEFAAGLFLQQAAGPKWQMDYIDFWERQRVRILEKNNFGVSPNDAGPLWLGLRLIAPRSLQAYQGVTYSKGAYVLLMQRSPLYDDRPTGDKHEQAFIDMMHDFMESYCDTPASTETFKAIVEKHMTKQMDIQQNGRLDWFFDQWVYGTQVPRYKFTYEGKRGEGGKIKIHAEVTQSEVDEHFVMFVPVFADFGNGMVRLAAGNCRKFHADGGFYSGPPAEEGGAECLQAYSGTLKSLAPSCENSRKRHF
jgi:hypothetical protein